MLHSFFGYKLNIMGRVSMTLVLLATLIVTFVRPQPAQAIVAAGLSEYYIPGFSDDLMAVLDAIDTNDIGTQLTNINTISVGGDNVRVYYDHWENGYGSEATGADETYTANAGAVLTFRSTTIPYPRGTSLTACTGSTFPAGGTGGNATNCYDGRDRIYVVGAAVSVAQAYWPTTANTNYANAWEIYPTKPYQMSYIIPVGENLYAAGTSFEDFYNVFVLVQATIDGTAVQIDDPGTGGIEVSTTLNRGETTRLDHIDAGTTVTGTHPVQVQFIVGISEHYNSRSYTAVPSSLWSSIYYSPVPGNSNLATPRNTDLFIYNPTGADLAINFEDSTGSGTFTVAANSTESFYNNVSRYVPADLAVYLAAADGVTPFWAIGSVDVCNSTFNWGFTLIPPHTLTDEYFASWSPGGWDQGTGQPVQANYSPIYVTPVQDNTTVFVDNSPTDGVVDQTYTLNRIQMRRIYDTADADNTGVHIWATGPLAIVWGEDPSTSPNASPGLDAGYTILPLNQEWLDVVLTIEKSANPSILPTTAGAKSTFTLVIESDSFSVDDVTVEDLLPANWGYVDNSTTIILPDGTPISGDPADPAVVGQQLTWSNFPLGPLDMFPNQTLTVIFQGYTLATSSVGYNTNKGVTSGTYNGSTFTAADTAMVYFSNLAVSKVANPSGTVNAGDTIQYTIQVANNGLVRQTNLVINDLLPVGTRYENGSSQVIGFKLFPSTITVGDNFNAIAYDNNSGTQNWSASWVEDDASQSPSVGDVQVLADGASQYVLRPGYSTAGAGSANNGTIYRVAGDLRPAAASY